MLLEGRSNEVDDAQTESAFCDATRRDQIRRKRELTLYRSEGWEVVACSRRPEDPSWC